jgi:hypothetical protein
MPVYTVHAPSAITADTRSAGDRVEFVRDGFHFWAFVFGVLWLIYHRLWLATLGYVVVTVGLMVGLTLLHVDSQTRFVVMLLIAIWMGLEAASLQRWTLSRRRWRQIDVVVADDAQMAERRFFDRWTAARGGPDDDASVDRGGPPPTRDVPPRPFSRPPSETDVLGLFPQPGGSR